MTASVLFATAEWDGRPSAAVTFRDGSVLERLRGQLASFGVRRQVVVVRPGRADAIRSACAAEGLEVVECESLADDLRALARIAHETRDRLVIAHADLVAHREALAVLLADPKAATGALVTRRDYYRALRINPRVRVERGHVVSAGSGYHVVTRPNATFLGLVRIGPDNQEVLADVAEELAVLSEKLPEPDAEGMPDAPARLLVGLARSGLQVTPRYLRGMHCLRVTDADGARVADDELRGTDEDRVLLDAAVKGSDGFFTTHFVSPYSKYIARWAARRRLTPNAVTVFSMALGVVAAGCLATGSRPGLVAGALVLQAAFTFDCVDGQLARYTRQFSLLGAWLDSVFDRAKEYVVYAGLAVGAAVSGVAADGRWNIWVLAVAALILQSLRHLVDFSYGARGRSVVASLPQRSLDDPADGLAGHVVGEEGEEGAPERAAVATVPRRSARRRVKDATAAVGRETERVPALYWFKRMIVLPIGERFALISVTAAFYDARVTFWALLLWGSIAACYVLTGRILRSLP